MPHIRGAMSKRTGILTALAALALTAALCFVLQKYDNKYTHAASQPIGGVLILSEAELETHPVRYLAREWRFFPDALLTPADERNGYFQYLDIGELSSLSGGCGSYSLTLLLPDEAREYALELTEVYTACTLYVNGETELTLGDIDGNRSGMGSRTVLFTAGGQTELLLAVRDGGGIYGGMTYPPAFGYAEAVVAQREGRLALHICMSLLALLLIMLAVSFSWRSGRRRGVLAVLGAVCFFAAAARPLLYGFFTAAYQPWTAIEVVCRQGIPLVALLLELELFKVRWRKAAIFALPCALGVLFAAAYAALAAVLPTAVRTAFSIASLLLKLYNAAALIGIAVWALYNGRRYSAPLLGGSLAVAVCLAFDRLYPMYEPILGGWYTEVGGCILTLTFAGVLWSEALDAYKFRLVYGETQALLTRKLEQQKEHYRQLSEQIERSHHAFHDMRHSLRTIRGMAERGHTDELLSFLDDYGAHLTEREVAVYSDNLAVDALIAYHAGMARSAGAECDMRLAVPSEPAFPEDELCIVLGNLLENAVAALEAQKAGAKRLYLRGNAEGGRLGIIMENSFDGKLRQSDGMFLSTKHDGPALGLSSVRSIAEKYGGLSDFSAENGLFRVQLMIPLQKK